MQKIVLDSIKGAKMREIIIQAGGKGTRLEGLTRNKPKCLVPYDNLPIIFHLFRKYPHAHFSIIADYKIDVLRKYLSIFGREFSYTIIKPQGSGTMSGLREAISHFSESESFMIIWCDLILGAEFRLPYEADFMESKTQKTSIVDSIESKGVTPPPPYIV